MRYIAVVCLIPWMVLFSQVTEKGFAMCGRAKQLMQLALTEGSLTPEQEKFDVSYYRIELSIEPDSNYYSGSVTMRAIILDTSLDTVELDFAARDDRLVTSVLLNGNPASFTYNDTLIRVPLNGEPALDDILEARVDFTVGPLPAGLRFFHFESYNGQDLIWTFSEPFMARRWWPCKDDPGDKADSVDLVITVPDPLIVASNGTLRSVEDAGDGRTTYHWHEGYPIATYLVSLAIYPYFEWSDQYISASNDTMPIQFYTLSDTSEFDPPELLPIYLKIDEMIEIMAGWFGEYPFLAEKYGTAEWRGGGAMEHQTLTSMLNIAEEYWVVHELAHQWWGDMITCASFHHIWLNEGFASYSGALWEEAQYGMFAYHEAMSGFVYYDAGTIYVEEPGDWNVLIDIVYIKGAWVLHMLRHVVGDATFFQILRAYGDSPELKYGTATTGQFQAICEEESGQDLEAFFQQWIYGEYYPEYSVSWHQATDSIHVTISQVQSSATVFQMPIDLEVVSSDISFIYVAENSGRVQNYAIHVPGGRVVQWVELDPDNWILKEVTYLGTEPVASLPRTLRLHPAYPNPFNAASTIRYDLPEGSDVSLVVYDILGQEVKRLVKGYMEPGYHPIQWNGRNSSGREVPSGIYIARLVTPEYSKAIKMVLLK